MGEDELDSPFEKVRSPKLKKKKVMSVASDKKGGPSSVNSGKHRSQTKGPAQSKQVSSSIGSEKVNHMVSEMFEAKISDYQTNSLHSAQQVPSVKRVDVISS